MATPAAPSPKEQGRRPDPFTKRDSYKLFKQQLTMFFIANDAIYDTEIKKILFTLSYMTEGAPGAWAQYRIERAQAQAVANVIPDAAWGTWDTFSMDLDTAFADPNKKQNALNDLEAVTWRGLKEPMTEFFQRLDILATRAGYNTNDNYMIGILKHQLPIEYIDYVYLERPVPTTYANYKTRIIKKRQSYPSPQRNHIWTSYPSRRSTTTHKWSSENWNRNHLWWTRTTNGYWSTENESKDLER
jgi:hypothetical protein